MQPSLETIELELAVLIRRVSLITTCCKFGNLDRSAYLLLHQIISHGSAGVKTLANESHLDISTISRQAAALEQKGYVYRIPDPLDGRACSFLVTDLGLKEYNNHRQARLTKIADNLEDWSEEECRMFGQLLRKYNLSIINK
ncbi:MarR family transcriptional regulator [Desulfosporosinus sp. PR]|uniref:MarR family winged helix-turn-helix transcriptional regulator n=1 Tax=Candidatus Desulfosporosinus nitrosoreducens TaxID=3401928 RepID=UPI0027F3146F|nr:MarR family transcriptional regulator [Desulfosporosinus sp. PR]MDQ7093334.1 MarR family transcriptional regulator [Desulfosporosinus sp. PR]